MRMSFTVDDDHAYRRTRDELCERFTAWAREQEVVGEPSDVELLLDWKVGYGDGRLDRWSPDDAEEFLLDWYPRKVVAPPDMWDAVPPTVVAYVDFLAHEGLLVPGSSAAAVRHRVETIAPRFRRAMAEPGSAKSMFAGALPDDLLDQLSQVTGLPPDMLLDALDDDEPRVVGPVRRPSDEEVAASIAGSRTLRQVRGLAAACASPGLLLTAKGNLRLADARRLVAELDTGDEAGTITTASDLPRLSMIVDTALEAGAVCRVKERLVAVARFAGLPESEVFGRVVRGAIPTDVEGDELATVLLGHLLDAGDAGLAADALIGAIGEVAEALGPYGPVQADLTALSARHQLDQLIDLGLVARTPDGSVVPTPAGRAVGSEILGEAGAEVIWRADPATADAVTLVGTLFMLEEDDAAADLATWSAAHPAGAIELVAAILDEDLLTGTVLSLLEMAATVLGPAVEAEALGRRDGPHGALVTMWLLTRGALDPASVDPAQMLNGTVEIAASMLDEEGPEGVVEFFDTDPEQTGEVLGHLWRAEHERTAEVLDALGRHHPDKKIAKAARKSLMKLRNR